MHSEELAQPVGPAAYGSSLITLQALDCVLQTGAQVQHNRTGTHQHNFVGQRRSISQWRQVCCALQGGRPRGVCGLCVVQQLLQQPGVGGGWGDVELGPARMGST